MSFKYKKIHSKIQHAYNREHHVIELAVVSYGQRKTERLTACQDAPDEAIYVA
jgi:hypothetical protein